MSTIDGDTVVDKEKKVWYNLIMLFMVAATWMRIMGLSFVIPSLSKLLLTLTAMLSSATTFICIILGYLLVTATIFKALFQESSIAYIDFLFSIRSMFDYMMGMYVYEVEKEYVIVHTLLLWVHIYIANIFLLNYLVAILSTVYEEMLENGEFAFKVMKYQFIERYNIAF